MSWKTYRRSSHFRPTVVGADARHGPDVGGEGDAAGAAVEHLTAEVPQDALVLGAVAEGLDHVLKRGLIRMISLAFFCVCMERLGVKVTH